MTGTPEVNGFDRLDDASKLECRICWWVYDPAEGDPQAQGLPLGSASLAVHLPLRASTEETRWPVRRPGSPCVSP